MSASLQPETGPACVGRDPAIWFPNSEREGRYDQARTICSGCSERVPCLDRAMAWERGHGAKDRHGMSGGLTPRERARLHRTGRMPDEGRVRAPRPAAVKPRLTNACRECGARIATHRVRCTTCAFVILNG